MTNSNAIVPNSIAKVKNSVANTMNSIVNRTKSFAKKPYLMFIVLLTKEGHRSVNIVVLIDVKHSLNGFSH